MLTNIHIDKMSLKNKEIYIAPFKLGPSRDPSKQKLKDK